MISDHDLVYSEFIYALDDVKMQGRWIRDEDLCHYIR
jgi:hypothetical protein